MISQKFTGNDFESLRLRQTRKSSLFWVSVSQDTRCSTGVAVGFLSQESLFGSEKEF